MVRGSLRWASRFGVCWGVVSRGRDVRPAAHSLSFASPKESKQRKGDPQSATPAHSLRGRPAAGRLRGAAAELTARLTALRSDSRGESEHEACALRRACAPRKRPAAGAASRGGEPHTGHCFARPGTRALRAALGFPRAWAERSDGPGVSPLPSVRAEKRRAAGACVCRRTHAPRALTCRSCPNGAHAVRAVSSAAAPADRASQVARSAAKGHAQQGRLSLGYFSLAKQRKVPRPPGRDPAPESNRKAKASLAPNSSSS